MIDDVAPHVGVETDGTGTTSPSGEPVPTPGIFDQESTFRQVMANSPESISPGVSPSGVSPSGVSLSGVSPSGAHPPGAPAVRSVQLGQISPTVTGLERNSLYLILDVELDVTVELGRSRLSIREILSLGPGSLVELDKLAGEPADLLVNGRRLARGEVVVIDDDFGLRITEILAPAERLNTLR